MFFYLIKKTVRTMSEDELNNRIAEFSNENLNSTIKMIQVARLTDSNKLDKLVITVDKLEELLKKLAINQERLMDQQNLVLGHILKALNLLNDQYEHRSMMENENKSV